MHNVGYQLGVLKHVGDNLLQAYDINEIIINGIHQGVLGLTSTGSGFPPE